jgi:hypothetical protein
MSTMPMTGDYIRESLELHLFWARIMKEHAIFLEAGFVCKDAAYIQEADAFKCQFEEILRETICLANGRISAEVLQSGELFTDKTLMAEQKTQELTGIAIDMSLTLQTMSLQPMGMMSSEMSMNMGMNPDMSLGMGMGSVLGGGSIEQCICLLHEKALACAHAKYMFLERIYEGVVKQCCLYTHNYPSIFHHQMEETKMYMMLIQRLQNHQIIDPTFHMVEMQMFWNHIMEEHAEIIRQSLDPSEEAMIEKADMHYEKFEKIEKEFEDSAQPRKSLKQITRETIIATESLKDFKAAGTELILDCQLKSVISALLGDHVLREAYHYLRILRMPLPEFNGGKG